MYLLAPALGSEELSRSAEALTITSDHSAGELTTLLANKAMIWKVDEIRVGSQNDRHSCLGVLHYMIYVDRYRIETFIETFFGRQGESSARRCDY